MRPSDARQIERNILIHDRIARKYDARHGEIFNEVEQQRLRASLQSAIDAVTTGAAPPKALDVGCGSGNLTRHMLALGLDVTSADVSRGCLDLVQSRYPGAQTLLMNGRDLSNVQDSTFDLVATYSVLHHIPDYLAAVREMARVCKPGGVVVIDHEQNEEFWSVNPLYREFRNKALRIDWRKYLTPANYFHRVWRIFDPRHANEGDIHVWPDDHIQWPAIKDELQRAGFEIVREDDYLLFNRLYRREVYDQYVGRCTDTKMIIFHATCAA
jgi:ubiquinone/menaquinone biosynthesis C-methylase UbiE